MSFLDESQSSLEREVEELESSEELSNNVPEWCEPHVTHLQEESKTPQFLKTDVMFEETNKKSKHKSKSKNEKHKCKEICVPSTIHKGKYDKQELEEEDEDDLPVFLREENNANNIHGSQNYYSSSNYSSPNSNSGRSRSGSINNNNWKSNDSCLSLINQSQSSGNGTADFLADIMESDNSTLPSTNLNSNINNNIDNVSLNKTSTNVLKTSAEELHFVTLRQFEWKLKRIRILGKGSYGCATLYKVETFHFVENDENNNINKINTGKSSLYTPSKTNNVFASLLEQTHKISGAAQSNTNFHYTPTHNKLCAERLLAHFTTCPFVVVKDINVQTMANRELEMAAIVTEVGIMSHLIQHNQFIQLYDFHELPEQMLYIICEYCSGGDLAMLMECVQAKNVSLKQNHHHHSLYGNRHSEKSNNSIQGCDNNKTETGDGTRDRHNRAKRNTNTKDPHAQKHKNNNKKQKELEEEEEENEVKSAGPHLLLEKYGLLSSHSLMLPILQKIPLSRSNNIITNKRSSDSIHSAHIRIPKQHHLEEEEEEYKLYFSEEFIASVLIQLLLALHQLQMEEKVIHRDIKPHNLFIKLSTPPLLLLNNIHEGEHDNNEYEELIIRLADFGVAIQLASSSSSQKSVSGATGSPYYMAPEVISEISYAFPADVWSLGVVLYELMTLQRPFQSISPSQLSKCITSNQHIPLQDVEYMKCAFSNELLDLVESLLQVNPCARPLPLRLLRSHFVLSHLYTLPVTILASLSVHLPSTTHKLINLNQSVNTKTDSTITVSSSPSTTPSNILMSLFTNDVLEKAWEYKEKVIEQLSTNSEANERTKINYNNTNICIEEKNKDANNSFDTNKAHSGQVNREDYWNEEYADDEFESEDD